MSKGDKFTVTMAVGPGAAVETIEATTNGATVDLAHDSKWVTVRELNQAGKTRRVAKFATIGVISVVEHKTNPE